MNAKVYKSTGSWYLVKDTYDKFWNARAKGAMKLDEITSTNPVAVGDEVDIEPEDETGNTAIITEIFDRNNYINRQSPRFKHQQHIVAANIDQSLLLATLREPRTSQGFIDRFLVASEAYHVPAIVVFNKSDLYREKELAQYQHLKEIYEQVGYNVMLISVLKNDGLEQLKKMLGNKITQTKNISGWSGKGQHTTTFAEMFDLPAGGQVIDTPGMREFGLVDISKQELSHYFPEMRDRLTGCQFNNCLHVDEPGCEIKNAVAEGAIAEDRYVSYYNILHSIEAKSY
jgi:ribosome biogenesis GTPase / thiamine phosphate phosphatase